ncbi:MAG: SusD/RagB family nutrient-binding outer membrane lipoprotein [Chitinophagaceae bacterium]
MKNISLLFFIGFVLVSCNKFDDDINVNPNLPAIASNTQLIANAQLSLPGLSSTPQGVYNAQHLSETQYPNLSLYNQISHSFYSLYTGPLMNLEAVLTAKSFDLNEGPVSNQLAVAKIMKAYFMWHITDRWGDVPYTEALKTKGDFTPKYDTQKAIYDSLFILLDQANTMIVTGNITNDIIYGGDVAKWKRLGNSIRLLMALRLSEVDQTKAKDEFNKALTAGVMTSNTDNLVFKHLPEAANQNYWYGQVVGLNRKWWALSETLVAKMKPVNDPRLAIYGDKNTVGNYIGLEFGKTDLSGADPSLLGAAIIKQDAPVSLVTYAQVLFARAEAAKRGWITGGDAVAKTNYDLAIDQSVRQWNNNSTTGLAAMMAAPEIIYDPAKAMEQIATQRWVHLFMHGYEAWAEWRRTGFPVLTTPGGKQVPTRQGYPVEEQFNNTANYNEAVQRQFGGKDDLYGKVWWDKP